MLVCSPQLGLAPESNSGGEVYDREVIRRLCQKGVKIFTMLPQNRPFQQHKNLEVEFAPLKTMYPPQIFSVFVLPYLIKTYRRQKFNLLRIHNPYFLGPAAAVFKKIFPRIPVVGSLLHLENRQLTGKYDYIITISQSTKNEIIETFNYPSEKISVAYPGVDKRFQPGEKKRGNIVIMFVGGLKPRKNPEFLLKVIAKINLPNVELVFAGDGPLRRRLSGKNVKVLGFIPENDKPKIYQQADVVVLPSIKEGFGMTLVEAGASGLPVVGNNSWSIPEIIVNGQTGFLANPGDVDDWAAKLIQLIKAPQLRQKMGVAGRRQVLTKFTWEKNINTQLKVYESLIR